MKAMWKRLGAIFRWDLQAVCELSTEDRDYHDYPDGVAGQPWHFYHHTCKRCGKKFYI